MAARRAAGIKPRGWVKALPPDELKAHERVWRIEENKRRRKTGKSREELALEFADVLARRKAIKRGRECLRRREQIKLHQAKPWLRGSTPGEIFAMRMQFDPEFAIKQRIRAAMKRKRKGYKIGDVLRGALKRGGRVTIEGFLGYTVPDLRRHLERQFTRGMTWEAFCAGEIHIDHIRPIVSFDVADPEELKAAWTLPNLRPLWARDNLEKSSKITLLL